MSDRDKMIGKLRIKLSNIEYAGHELSDVTDQHGDKLVDTEMKIFVALIYINNAANSVRDLIKKIEDEQDDE
nr:MAG TPA: hypothetical protein [Caudoviricetes sp.]